MGMGADVAEHTNAIPESWQIANWDDHDPDLFTLDMDLDLDLDLSMDGMVGSRM
jgi:hypothetical protein